MQCDLIRFMVVTSKVNKRCNNQHVGDDNRNAQNQYDAGLDEWLHRKDEGVVVGVVEDDHRRYVARMEHDHQWQAGEASGGYARRRRWRSRLPACCVLRPGAAGAASSERRSAVLCMPITSCSRAPPAPLLVDSSIQLQKHIHANYIMIAHLIVHSPARKKNSIIKEG